MAPARLQRSSEEKLLFGVCGGLAAYLDLEPVLVRLSFVLLAFLGGVGVIAYLVLAIIMPRETTAVSEPAGIVGENLQSMPGEVAEAGRRLADTLRQPQGQGEAGQGSEAVRPRAAFALVLIAVGAIALLANLGAFSWWTWGKLWPLLLVAMGIALFLGRRRG